MTMEGFTAMAGEVGNSRDTVVINFLTALLLGRM